MADAGRLQRREIVERRRVAVRQGLGAVDDQQRLAVELVGGEPVGIELADELAGVLVQPVGARVIAAHRQRQSLAAEDQRLGLDRVVARQRRDRRRRQLDRQPDPHRAARDEEIDRRLVERVDERPADERRAGEQADRGDVVGLDHRLVAAAGADFVHLAVGGDERQRRIDDLLAARRRAARRSPAGRRRRTARAWSRRPRRDRRNRPAPRRRRGNRNRAAAPASS